MNSRDRNTKELTARSRDRQAVHWHNLLRSGEPSWQQLKEYADWVTDSPGNDKALAEVEELTDSLMELESDKDISSLIGDALVVAEVAKYRRRWYIGIAATVTLALGVVFFQLGAERTTAVDYVTAVGEQKTHRLEDGTLITLNTATSIRIGYSDNGRNVQLTQGEALFNVVPDADRPFTVATKFGKTRVLGTLFNVRVRREDVEVSLLEGQVNVAPEGASEKTVQLTEGQQVALLANGDLSPVKKVKAQDILLWTERLFNFDNISLEQAVAEINRYSTKKLVILDPSIKDVRINIRIGIDQIDSFLNVCEELFGIRVDRRIGEIILSKRPSADK